jgi:hypothetical protein
MCSLNQYEFTVLNHSEYLYLLLKTLYIYKRLTHKFVIAPIYFITYAHMHWTIHMFWTGIKDMKNEHAKVKQM